MKNMSFYLAVLQAQQLRTLYIGKLMSPEETASALQNRSDFEKNRISGWYLCGEVHPDMWKHANAVRGSLNAQLFVLGPTPDNPLAYAVFVQEIGHWQHRLVLPLLGLSVGKLVDSLQTTPIGLSLGDDESDRALVLPIKVPLSSAAEMRKYFQANVVEPIETLEAATLMALLLTSPVSSIPISRQRIQKSCVTLILPPELLAIAEVPIQGNQH